MNIGENKIKLVYIGCFRDGTGWGQAATDYILALDKAGVDVVPRALKLNNADYTPPERLVELESKSSSGADVVIQHVLPHQLDYNGKLRNFALYASETSHFKNTTWAEHLNCMDGVIVINNQMVSSAKESKVNAPISVVPHATNLEKFQMSYKTFETLKPFKENGDFIFYTVGEFIRRKNYAALLKAFHLEFDPSEPVQIVLKTSSSGKNSEECLNYVKDFCNAVKSGLKMHGGKLENYKKEIIIADRLTEQGIMRLHSSCDVFVQPSYGEAWSIPAFDAMAMGKTPIVSGHTGYLDYVSNDTGWLVNFHEEPVFGVNDTFNDLFVGNESWNAVDINHLRRCMREAYENKNIRETKSLNGISAAYNFSYDVVGKKMKEVLEQNGSSQQQARIRLEDSKRQLFSRASQEEGS